MKPAVSDEEFIAVWRELGSPALVAKRLGMSERRVYSRRNRLKLQAADLESWNPQNNVLKNKQGVLEVKLLNGVILVGSDAHFWPEIRTTAFRGFLWACRTLKPQIIVLNGDVFDGARISRHAPIGWEKRPTVIDELKAVDERLIEIHEAAPTARKLWPLGNHDARFESRLASVAPEYAQVKGVHLKDHFPDWATCWRIDVNDDVVIKHQMRGGIHATHNNTLNAGRTMVTGHLHSLKVTPFSDFNGTRYGVDTGTLADADGPQFVDYMEAGAANWRSGFAVLTIKDGRLLWPELVIKYDEDHVQFRGEVIPV
jgi:hypothetical protein